MSPPPPPTSRDACNNSPHTVGGLALFSPFENGKKKKKKKKTPNWARKLCPYLHTQLAGERDPRESFSSPRPPPTSQCLSKPLQEQSSITSDVPGGSHVWRHPTRRELAMHTFRRHLLYVHTYVSRCFGVTRLRPCVACWSSPNWYVPPLPLPCRPLSCCPPSSSYVSAGARYT